jgi:hypothetical protein
MNRSRHPAPGVLQKSLDLLDCKGVDFLGSEPFEAQDKKSLHEYWNKGVSLAWSRVEESYRSSGHDVGLLLVQVARSCLQTRSNETGAEEAIEVRR